MRLLIAPIWTISNASGASEFLDFKDLADEMFKGKEPLYLYLYAPLRFQGKLPEIENTKILWYDDDKSLYYDQEVEIPEGFLRMFNERIGYYPIDAVWTNRTQAAMMMGRMLWDFRTKRNSIPVFIEVFESIDRNKGQTKITDLEMVTRTMAYAYECPIFDSEVEMAKAINSATYYVRGAVVDKIIQNSVVIPHNIPSAKIDVYKRNRTANEKFVVFFGGRLNCSKRAKQLLEIYDMFYAFGRDVEIVVTSPRAESKMGNKWKKKYKEIRFIYNCSFDKFAEEMVRADVVLSCSIHEGLTLGILQMMYAGPVVILPKLYWVKGLMKDRYEDYKFLYKNFDEAKMMLRYVYENYDESQKEMEKIRKFVKDMYGERMNYGIQRLEFMKDKIGQRSGFVTSIECIKELLERTLSEFSGTVSLEEFYDRMIKNSNSFSKNRPITRGMPSKYRVYKWLKNQGLEDICDSEMAKYRIGEKIERHSKSIVTTEKGL